MGKYDRVNAVQVRIQRDKVTLRFELKKKAFVQQQCQEMGECA
jgi:hypothetical protein